MHLDLLLWRAKAGQAYYRKKQGRPSGRIRKLGRVIPFPSVLLPAVAPFPVPFKPFVIAQGVFHVPFIPFLMGTFVGRGALFFFEGFLGARYGAAAKDFVLHQKWASVAILPVLVFLVLAIRRLPLVRRGTDLGNGLKFRSRGVPVPRAISFGSASEAKLTGVPIVTCTWPGRARMRFACRRS